MTLSRRQLLKLAGAGLASGMLASTLRPRTVSAQAAVPAPAEAGTRAAPDLVTAELRAQVGSVRVADQTARLWTYGGRFPGPLLRLREGDHVLLDFDNALAEDTNLHTHGLHVSPSVDDPFRHVAPGERVRLEFDVPHGSAGTYWYHPHLHGTVATQLFAGLAGPILIEGPLDAELGDVDDHLLVLKDIALTHGEPAAHHHGDWMDGKEGDLVTVNGELRPAVTVATSTVRLRLLNASNARYYRLALEHHAMHLIASDGGLLGAPIELEELLLAPGERAEVLVNLEDAGAFRLFDLPYDRGAMMMGMGAMHDEHTADPPAAGGMAGMGGAAGHGMHGAPAPAGDEAAVLLTLVARSEARPAPLPRTLGTVDRLDVDAVAVHRTVEFSEDHMAARFFVNGRLFDPARTDFAGRVGTLEVWEIVNRGDMDHPFHLHTYPFQVLSRNGVAEPFRAWKDVVNLREHDVVRIAVPVETFTGRTVFHCHIVEHEDRGMMGTFEVT
jgi:FtsP/CotA-like multicopper oxidase with cupredoxin domain